jgi:hypothetical protein
MEEEEEMSYMVSVEFMNALQEEFTRALRSSAASHLHVDKSTVEAVLSTVESELTKPSGGALKPFQLARRVRQLGRNFQGAGLETDAKGKITFRGHKFSGAIELLRAMNAGRVKPSELAKALNSGEHNVEVRVSGEAHDLLVDCAELLAGGAFLSESDLIDLLLSVVSFQGEEISLPVVQQQRMGLMGVISHLGAHIARLGAQLHLTGDKYSLVSFLRRVHQMLDQSADDIFSAMEAAEAAAESGRPQRFGASDKKGVPRHEITPGPSGSLELKWDYSVDLEFQSLDDLEVTLLPKLHDANVLSEGARSALKRIIGLMLSGKELHKQAAAPIVAALFSTPLAEKHVARLRAQHYQQKEEEEDVPEAEEDAPADEEPVVLPAEGLAEDDDDDDDDDDEEETGQNEAEVPAEQRGNLYGLKP